MRSHIGRATGNKSCPFRFSGGRRYLFPKDVWSPAGGWWNNEPPNWERNTGFAFIGVAVLAGLVFRLSADREVSFELVVS